MTVTSLCFICAKTFVIKREEYYSLQCVSAKLVGSGNKFVKVFSAMLLLTLQRKLHYTDVSTYTECTENSRSSYCRYTEYFQS